VSHRLEHHHAPHHGEDRREPSPLGSCHRTEILLQAAPLGLVPVELGLQVVDLVRDGIRRFGQLPEEVLDQTDPQVVVAVVPGVEADLPHIRREGGFRPCRLFGQRRHPHPELAHEAGLPGAPVDGVARTALSRNVEVSRRRTRSSRVVTSSAIFARTSSESARYSATVMAVSSNTPSVVRDVVATTASPFASWLIE